MGFRSSALWSVFTATGLFVGGCTRPPEQNNQQPPPPETRQDGTLVRAAAGGTVALGPVTLVIPPRSLHQDTVIALEQLPAVPEGAPGDFKPTGPGFRFTPAGTQFALDRPAILTMPYNPAALQDQGLDTRTVQLAYFDENLGRYHSVGGQLDTDSGVITARIEHFTLYTVIAASLVPGNNAPTVAPQSPIPATLRAGAPIYLRALVRDYDSGGSVAGAWLHYRQGSTGPFQMVAMKAEPTLDVFSGVIPAAAAVINAADTDLQYYFSARDNLGATRTTLTPGTNLPTSVEFTQSYQPATLLLTATGGANMAAGFERLLTVTARDAANVSFSLVPEYVSVTGGVGEATIGATGVTFRARAVGSGSVVAGFGAETATSAVVVQNGALSRVVILDEHGLPLEGTRVVSQGVRVQLDALGEDAWGNTVLVTPVWSVDSQLGSISTGGVLDTLDAAASGQVRATVGSVVGVQWFVVTPRELKTRLVLGPTPAARLTAVGERNLTPYVAYAEHDGTKYVLKVKHLNGGVWIDDGGPITTEDVDALAIAGSTGRLQVAWVEGTHVRSAHLEGTTWVQDGGDLAVSSTVPLGAGSYRVSLMMQGDTPWVGWDEDGPLGQGGYVARWSGSGWEIMGGRLNAPGAQVLMPRLALVGGVPHVAFMQLPAAGAPEVHVQRWNGTAWTSLGGALNSLPSGQADNPSIAAVDGKPTVAFRNTYSMDSYRLFVRQWDGSNWVYLGDPVAGVPSGGFNLLGQLSLVGDGPAPYLSVSEGVSQADATARYRLLHYNPFTASWVDDVTGPVYPPAGLPAAMNTTISFAAGRIYQTRSEPNGVERVLSFDVTIRDVAPSTIIYLDDDSTYVVGTPVVANVPVVTGGRPSNYSVSPPLPMGLALDPLTGIISGTPVQEQPRTRHTVRAENSAGALDAVLHIEVVAPAPGVLSYAYPDTTYTDGTSITPNTASVTGGGSFVFSVSPALPAGLTLNPSNGTISGTPRVAQARSLYLVTASSTGGASTATIAITIVPAAPATLAYSPANVVAVVGQPVSDLHPVTTGGTPTAYTVTPALPPGLSLHALTGVLSGTPTVVTGPVDHVITGTNIAGQATATVRIEVVHAPPSSLAYGVVTASYRVNEPIAPNVPTASTPGGSYSVIPSLPAGLALDVGTGIISGTPTTASPGATYTVTVSTGSGSASTVLSITVLPVAPAGLSYSANVAIYRPGVLITPNVPTLTSGVAASFSVSPGLPSGLLMDPATGVISGTPNAPLPQTDFVVTASNAGGSTTAVLRITVRDAAPQGLTYSQLTPVYGLGTPITPNVATLTAGTGASFGISPALPPGLSFDTSTGRISGTPTALHPATQHTVTASNAEGASTVIIIITVVEYPPIGLVYSQPNAQYQFNVFAGPNIPSYAGGTATAFSIVPALTAGLTLDPLTGIISGVPTQLSPPTVYTVTVTNTAGSATGTVTITVGQAPTILTFPPVYTTVNQGDDATFFVSAAGEGQLHYAWEVNGVPVGGDSPSLTLTSVTPAMDQAQVWVQVSSLYGAAAAQVGILGVVPLPLSTIGAPAMAYKGDAVTLSVPVQGGCTFSWTATAGTFSGATDTRTVTWSRNDLGTATVSVTVTNTLGRTSTGTASVQTVERAVADLFVARDRVLPGTRAIPVSVNSKPGLTYAWSVGAPTGAATLTLTGSGASNINRFDVGPGKGSVPLTVTVTDATGATATRTRTVVVDGGFFMPAISHHMATARGDQQAVKLKDGRVLVVGEGYTSTAGPAYAEVFDPLTNTWGITGPMMQRRVSAGVAMLDDGRVVAAGGMNNTGTNPVGTAEIYDAVTNLWTALPGMRSLRMEHTLSPLPGNRLLAVGGRSGFAAGNTLMSAEIYDAAANRWDLSTNMPWQRRLHKANRVSNGEVWVSGGADDAGMLFSQLIAFDPTTEAWRTVTSAWFLQRYYHQAFAADLPWYGNVLVMVGGYNFEGVNNGCQSNGLIGYTVALRVPDGALLWGDCGIPVHGFGAAGTLVDGKIVVAGGYDNPGPGRVRADTYVSAASGAQYVGNLRAPRASAAFVGLDDGRGMIIGGYSSIASGWVPTPTVEFFHGADWGPPSSAHPRHLYNTVRLPDGSTLLLGGQGRETVAVSNVVEAYDPVADSFSLRSPMPDRLIYMGASLMLDGRVLVTGGYREGGAETRGVSSASYAYNPASNSWAGVAAMSTPRHEHGQQTLPDGRVLVFGGYNAGYLASTEVYDPVLDTWSAGPNMMEPRAFMGSVLLPNGSVLICGGAPSATSCELFNPATDSFSAVAPLPSYPGAHAYGSLPMFLLSGNRVLVGPHVSAGGATAVRPYIYDVGADSWLAGAVTPYQFLAGGQFLATGDRLVVAANYNVSVYDANADTWALKGNVRVPRTYAGIVAGPSGTVVVGPGIASTLGYVGSITRVNLDTGVFEDTDNLPLDAVQTFSTALPTGEVLVGGGLDQVQGAVDRVMAYNPADHRVRQLPLMPETRRLGTAHALDNGTVLVAGGYNDATNLPRGSLLLDLGTNVWSSVPMVSPRYHHAGVKLLDGRVAVFGGWNHSTWLADVEVFDPATSTWTGAGTLAQGRYYPSAVLLPDGRVLVAGGYGGGTLDQAEIWDPVTATSTVVSSMPVSASEFPMVVLSDGSVLAAGGYPGALAALDAARAFSVTTGTWASAGSSYPQYGGLLVPLPGARALLFGGRNDADPVWDILDSGALYDGTTGTWSPGPSMFGRRYTHSAVKIADGRVVITGGGPASIELFAP